MCQSGVWNPAILGSCIQGGIGGSIGTTLPGSIGFPNTGGLGSGVQCAAAPQPLNGQVQYRYFFAFEEIHSNDLLTLLAAVLHLAAYIPPAP